MPSVQSCFYPNMGSSTLIKVEIATVQLDTEVVNFLSCSMIFGFYKPFCLYITVPYFSAFSEYPPSLHNAFSDTHTLSEIRHRLSSYISYFSFYFHHTPFAFDTLLILPFDRLSVVKAALHVLLRKALKNPLSPFWLLLIFSLKQLGFSPAIVH